MNASGESQIDKTTFGPLFFVGRQPILDRSQSTFAYELLFRSSDTNAAHVTDDVSATITVINNALNELGIDALLGNSLGFINFNGTLLMSDTIELLPKERVVLEILETTRITPQLVERCRQLRRSGFMLAMDDFTQYDAAYMGMLDVVQIVKVDIQHMAEQQLKDITAKLRQHKVQLLAEKVDSKLQFAHCAELGFELFQGYYFAKPEIVKGKRLSQSQATLMRLLGMVLGDSDLGEIESVIKHAPSLMINFLRLVNSVAANPGRHISSVSAGVMYLGRRQLQRWLQLLLFADAAAGAKFPTPLLQLAATRGKLLETLASGNGELKDKAFIVGVMSLMEALLGQRMADIIRPLPLSVEVNDALLRRDGKLGRLLDLAEALETNDPDRIAKCRAALPELSVQQLSLAQAEAMAWVNAISDMKG